jgi:MFS family permease
VSHSSIPWRRLVLAILIVALSTQPVFLIGAAFIQINEDIALSTTTLGLLTAAFFLTASLSSAPLGKTVERIGWRTAIRINAAISAAVLLAVGFFADSVVTLAVLLVVAGLTYGLANPAANMSLAERVDPGRRGLIFGIKHGGIPTSTLLAGFAVPVLALTLGWRATFVAAALLFPIVMALIPPRNDDEEPIEGADEPGPGAQPMRLSQLTTLAIGSSMATWAAMALGTFLVAAAVNTGLSEGSAGLLLFAGSAASIAARVITGFVTDRTRGQGFAGLAVLMGFGGLVFLLLPSAAGIGFVVLVLLAFTTGWGWPGLMTFTVVNANAGTTAASSAITQAGVFLGAGGGPIVLGWAIDRWSYDTSWTLVAASLLLAASIVTAVGARTRVSAPLESWSRET